MIDYASIVILAIVAIATAYVLIVGLNKLNGTTANEIYQSVRDSVGAGIYYGLRFIAICWLVGTMFSRFA